jgi:hypothetical protein
MASFAVVLPHRIDFMYSTTLHRAVRFACAALLTAAAPLAMAWGPQGHAIVADIAQAHLTPAATAQVSALLKLDGDDRLDQIASWADDNRKQFPKTGVWHYVDIPLDEPSYVAARDCHDGECVVAKIDEFAKVLADHSAAPQDRLLALKWLVHFVGDEHQPLHAEDHADKGGNDVQEIYFGKGTNLHRIWDSGIIEQQLGLPLGPNYSIDRAQVAAAASKLDAAITPAQRAAWAPAGLLPHLDTASIAWANESHKLAREVAYADLPKHPNDDWSAAYQAKAWPVVQTRLQQAGVRLAAILNEALTTP